MRLASLVVVNRPGIGPDDPGQWPDLGPDALPIQKVSIPPIGIASHDLRRRRAEGRSIRYQVPRGVEAYINAHGLYRRAEATDRARLQCVETLPRNRPGGTLARPRNLRAA